MALKGQTTTKFGGTITVKQLEAYVEAKKEQAIRDVEMYREYHVNKKTLREVAAVFGLSHMQIKYRLESMIGFINDMSSNR